MEEIFVTHSKGNAYFLAGYSVENEFKLLAASPGVKSIDQSYVTDI